MYISYPENITNIDKRQKLSSQIQRKLINKIKTVKINKRERKHNIFYNEVDKIKFKLSDSAYSEGIEL